MKYKVVFVLCLLLIVLTACDLSYFQSEASAEKTQAAHNANIEAASNAKKTQRALEALNKPKPTKKPGGVLSSSSCTEYSGEYQVVFIDGVADVYGGVDAPSTSVKGTVTGGAAGIEARCGAYYRLQGVDWWGWVKISDTHP